MARAPGGSASGRGAGVRLGGVTVENPANSPHSGSASSDGAPPTDAPRSRQWFDRALAATPGGVNSPVRITAEHTAVRDTKDRAAGHFTTSRHQWSAFVSAIRAGRYDC